MQRKLTLGDLPPDALAGKRVLVRVDYNVPLEEGRVGDDGRIRATLPTLQTLLDAGATPVLLSHFGRPKGERKAEYSLKPVAERLEELLDGPVRFVEETAGEGARQALDGVEPGTVVLLENTRFDPGEEANDEDLARQMADLGDLYVNDAFGAAHRAHASTAGVAEVMRSGGSPAVAGQLMQRELQFLGDALADPERPFVAIIGGAKISGKIEVIRALLPEVDRLLIGGAMANTFFRALGLDTGTSLVEEDRISLAKELLEEGGEKILLPVDVRVTDRIEADATAGTVPREEIPADRSAVDIGPETEALYRKEIEEARTVVWNGPMGIFEMKPFASGTRAVADALVSATDAGATTIVGGGDSAAAIADFGLAERVSHVSTGGGASLEFMEGKELPGVAALTDAEEEG
jgi:phosphoglycerate kinase